MGQIQPNVPALAWLDKTGALAPLEDGLHVTLSRRDKASFAAGPIGQGSVP